MAGIHRPMRDRGAEARRLGILRTARTLAAAAGAAGSGQLLEALGVSGALPGLLGLLLRRGAGLGRGSGGGGGLPRGLLGGGQLLAPGRLVLLETALLVLLSGAAVARLVATRRRLRFGHRSPRCEYKAP